MFYSCIFYNTFKRSLSVQTRNLVPRKTWSLQINLLCVKTTMKLSTWSTTDYFICRNLLSMYWLWVLNINKNFFAIVVSQNNVCLSSFIDQPSLCTFMEFCGCHWMQVSFVGNTLWAVFGSFKHLHVTLKVENYREEYVLFLTWICSATYKTGLGSLPF